MSDAIERLREIVRNFTHIADAQVLHILRPTHPLTMGDLRAALARIAELEAERDRWQESLLHQARETEYYRGLVEQCGLEFGREAYVADDGSVSEGILHARIPGLVEDALGRVEGLEEDVVRLERLLRLANEMAAAYRGSGVESVERERVLNQRIAELEGLLRGARRVCERHGHIVMADEITAALERKP